MKVYAYAIIDSNGEVDNSVNGIDGAGIYSIPCRDIGVVVSDFDREPRDIKLEHAVEHENVVESLMAEFTVLPVRFRTVFNSREHALGMMNDYYAEFKMNMSRLYNKVEFGIKVIWPGDATRKRIADACESKGCSRENHVSANHGEAENARGDSPARDFVKEKLGQYRIDREFEEEADRRIAVVDSYFSKLAVEKKLEKLRSSNLLLSACYLIEKKRQTDFQEAFERLRSGAGDLKYLMSGPWPPYNFVALTRNRERGIS